MNPGTPLRRVVAWGGRGPEGRNLTVADLRCAKGKRRFTQVTANSEEEARAAQEAGIDLIIANSRNTAAARAGGGPLFLTAAIALGCVPLLQLGLLDMVLGSRVPGTVAAAGVGATALVLYLGVMLCGLYPSWLAARVKPAEALHHDY